MIEYVEKIFTPAVRTYIYHLCLALAGLGVVYGYFGDKELGALMTVVSALLGNGLATTFKPTRKVKPTVDVSKDNPNVVVVEE